MLTATVVKKMNAELIAAMAEIATKYGCSVQQENSTYNDHTLNMKVKVFIASEDSPKVPADQVKAYAAMAPLYGLEESWLGKEFTHKGKTLKVAGLNTRRPKFCVVLVDTKTNQVSACNRELVQHYLKK